MRRGRQCGSRLPVTGKTFPGICSSDFGKQSRSLGRSQFAVEQLKLVDDSAEVFLGRGTGTNGQRSGVGQAGGLDVQQPDIGALYQVAVGFAYPGGGLSVDEQSHADVVGRGVLVCGRCVPDGQRCDQMHPLADAEHTLDTVPHTAEATAVVDVQLQHVALGPKVHAVVGLSRLVSRSFGEQAVPGSVTSGMEIDKQQGHRDSICP